ncbi:leucine-rich repeat domain-containing protein [Pontibacter sp. H259]|uniref:leucine-rich repeat domain-containing protein n=1 Tax=Pontibacter sp. H259 TaxID=3133421 RepID=UPI0030C5924A
MRLEKLEMLDLYTNEIKSISDETKYLKNLKELQIFDNQIDSIPDNIGDLKSLEKLEIWNNPIRYISPNISKLTKLKSIRLDDDYLSEKDKQNLKVWLPNCAIFFQTRLKKF